jgi:hypothetical protein
MGQPRLRQRPTMMSATQVCRENPNSKNEQCLIRMEAWVLSWIHASLRHIDIEMTSPVDVVK